ncbi:MAG TPA: hypothetical protein VFJ96_11920 [Gemmatimonadaceae bacterium]|nr:hypothetical protein [Gemmatimonadaceae bacterium]
MKHRWAAPFVVLALGALMPAVAVAQGNVNPFPDHERSPGFELGQNFPNPFNPATTIPFTIGDPPTCTDPGREYRVTLRIYNVLAQLVAVPILQGGDESIGQPVVNLSLHCGSYTAYWSGNYLSTSMQVPAGVYLYSIEVDGKSVVKKMIMSK